MTNRIENIVIATISAVVAIIATVLIVQATSIKPLQSQIQKQNEAIVELAKIEKYRYEISNEFGKMKPKDAQIILDLDNKLDALTITPGDTVQAPVDTKKQNLIQKLFSKRPKVHSSGGNPY